MTTDRGSLVSLDSSASKQSIRVAIYARALAFLRAGTSGETPGPIAESFFEFVGSEKWRLDALDVALKHANRRDTLERLLEQAEKIAEFVKNPPEPEPEPVAEKTVEPATVKKPTSKKPRSQKK